MILLLACAAEDSAGPACPPVGTPGVAAGDVATDVTFAECGGEPVSIAALCGSPALLVSWYGWCPSCDDNAELGRQLAAFTEAYPSTARVWMDAGKGMEIYGGTDTIVVLDREGMISFARQTSTASAIVEAVDAVVE